MAEEVICIEAWLGTQCLVPFSTSATCLPFSSGMASSHGRGAEGMTERELGGSCLSPLLDEVQCQKVGCKRVRKSGEGSSEGLWEGG